MSRQTKSELILGKYIPEEYAAMFGCDPCFDRAPRLPGDGYKFYNYGSEKQEITNEWLGSFIGAIDRTIRELQCQSRLSRISNDDDVEGLEQLKRHVISQKVN